MKIILYSLHVLIISHLRLLSCKMQYVHKIIAKRIQGGNRKFLGSIQYTLTYYRTGNMLKIIIYILFIMNVQLIPLSINLFFLGATFTVFEQNQKPC